MIEAIKYRRSLGCEDRELYDRALGLAYDTIIHPEPYKGVKKLDWLLRNNSLDPANTPVSKAVCHAILSWKRQSNISSPLEIIE